MPVNTYGVNVTHDSKIVSGSNSNPLGYIEYNGFVFSGPRFRWTISVQPKMSEDGRTTIGNVYRLMVRYIATDDQDGVSAFIHDSPQKSMWAARGVLQEARTRLTKNGRCLVIYNMGFDISVNCPGMNTVYNVWDTNYGPKCVDLQIRPIGNGLCSQLDWTCEWIIPECVVEPGTGHPDHKTSGITDTGNLSNIGFPFTNPALHDYVESFSMTVGFSIDMYGLTSRVVSGNVVIPLNRASATGDGSETDLITVADHIRELIAPPIPVGFRRVRQEWNVSADCKSLSFTITDEELADRWPYPPGIVRLDLRHSVQVDQVATVGDSHVRCNISGAIEIAKGYDLEIAFYRVILLAQSRIDRAIEANKVAAGPNDQSRVMVTSISITEKLFGGIGVEFSIDYLIMKAVSALRLGIVNATGLFKDFNNLDAINLDHKEWLLSLGHNPDNNEFAVNKPLHQRGLANLTYGFSNNPIVGPCDINNSLPAFNDSDVVPVPQNGGSLGLTCPNTGFAYVEWDSNIEVVVDNVVVYHEPLKGPNQGSGGGNEEDNTVETSEGESMTPIPYRSSNVPLITERVRNNSDMIIRLKGKASRIGAHPQIPERLNERYKQFKDLIEPTKNNKIRRSKGGRVGACPLFEAQWEINYKVKDTNPDSVANLLGMLEDLLGYTGDDPDMYKMDGP
ncbi:MAG: hypothetical protein QXT45_05845 [Candidatus Bilamarchaeaceae archaeon]